MTPDEIRAVRSRLGWSLDRLAEALSVHRMTLWKWEQPAGGPHHLTPEHPGMLRLALERLEQTHARD